MSQWHPGCMKYT